MEDDGTIRCICGYDHDDGFTIQCEKCLVWQHAACVGITEDCVPNEYFCEKCLPRKLDFQVIFEYFFIRSKYCFHPNKAARELQKRKKMPRRKSRQTHSSSSSPGIGARKKKHLKELSIDPTAEQFLLDELLGEEVPPFSEDFISAKKNSLFDENIKSQLKTWLLEARKLLEDDHSSASLVESKNSGLDVSKKLEEVKPKSIMDISAMINDEAELQPSQSHLKAQNGSDKVDSKIESVTSVSKKENLGKIIKFDNHLHLLLDNEYFYQKSQVAKVSVHTVNATRSQDRSGIFVNEMIDTEIFIMEAVGEITPKSHVLESIHPQERYVFCHESIDIALDCRKFGNEARFVRYSCKPNAEFRFFLNNCVSLNESNGSDLHENSNLDGDLLKVGLFATKTLQKLEEITVPHYQLAQKPDDGLKFARLAANCACSDRNSCEFWAELRQRLSSGDLSTLMHHQNPLKHSTSNTRRRSVTPSPAPYDLNTNNTGYYPNHNHNQIVADNPNNHSLLPSNNIGNNSHLRNHSSFQNPTMEHDPISPNNDSLFESDLFTKPLKFLTREERKMRDELLRFAKMEKQTRLSNTSKTQRKSSKNEMGKLDRKQSVNQSDKSGYDSSSSTSTSASISSNGSKRRRNNNSHRGSRASSPNHSLTDSLKIPVKSSFFSKKTWLKMFNSGIDRNEWKRINFSRDSTPSIQSSHEDQDLIDVVSDMTEHVAEQTEIMGRRPSAVEMDAGASTNTSQSLEKLFDEQKAVVLDGSTSNQPADVKPEPEFNFPASETQTPLAQQSNNTTTSIDVQTNFKEASEEHSLETVPGSASTAISQGTKRPAPEEGDELKENQQADVVSSQELEPNNDQKHEEKPPTARISFKDYKKKRKLRQEQEEKKDGESMTAGLKPSPAPKDKTNQLPKSELNNSSAISPQE